MVREIAKVLLEAKAVSLRPKDPFVYASGNKGPIYCDNRILISMPEKSKAVIEAFLEELKKKEFDIVAGTATSGIPWASWIAMKLNKPLIYVRNSSKAHGKENRVEGILGKGKKVVVIEDLIMTGGSSIGAVEAVREKGGVVDDCVAIFNYGRKKAKENFENAKCRLTSLTDFSELIEVAEEMKYIDEEEKEILMEWKEDPENWRPK